jgi:membrane protease YdiL (CAAX protease family)/ferredoxin
MKQGPPLTLEPRLCDRCGNCLAACERDALKVGRTYLKVDWARCNACGACARACGRRAIVMRGVPAKRTSGAATQPARPRPQARHTTGTPRSRSAEKVAEAKASGKAGDATAASDRALLKRVRDMTPRGAGVGARPPKSGKRGGFQWTLLEAAAMLSVTFSAFTAKETIPLWPGFSTFAAGIEVPVRVGLLALYYVVQVAVLVWLVRRRGGEPAAAVGLRSTGGTFGRTVMSVGLVVAGLVATRLIASLYAYVTREFGLMPSTSADLPTLFGSNASGFVLALLMVVVVGPVVEEAVFRAALLEGLAARFGSWPGIVLQALLFAAFHRSLWLLFPTFVLGVALGWLAHERESLWPPIALHALYNAITVAAAFLVTASPQVV